MTAAQLAERVAATHQLLLDAAQSVEDADLGWRPAAAAPSIAFHLWHCGRWADRWAAALGAPEQVWTRDSLAEAWGFPAEIGPPVTGMRLPDEVAAALPFPERQALTAYLRASFAGLEAELARLDDARLLERGDDLLGEERELGASLLRQLAHANRHLGMIEALRGVRGQHGTATV
jgi:uncharacterized damage-inducible protein DinB